MGHINSQTYDNAGNMASVTDGNGKTLFYTYDHNGNISMHTLWDCYTGEYTWQYYYDGNQLVSIQCYSKDMLMTTFIFEAEPVAVDQETADALSAIVQYIIANT